MLGHISIFQPWIPASVKESMDLVHHTAEGMPADSSLHALPIKGCKITYPMSEGTRSFLLDNFYFDPIGSFHLLTPYPTVSTSEKVYAGWIGIYLR
jgi:hypothetical protein